MTSVATAPIASPPPYNPQYAAPPTMDAATWQQQQQQFLQWQQFQLWQQQQQQAATSYPLTQPVTNTGVAPATTVPPFSNALTQPVPNVTTTAATPSGMNDKETTNDNTTASPNATAANTSTSTNPTTNANNTSSSGGSTNVLDQLSSLLATLSSGLNSVNSNGSSFWKSIATTGQQMQPLVKLCKSCASAS